ncbi:MAG: carboxypeptidase regulatory-like domain-containing protein [Bacteroidia bacterium]|nr:carboxypeptidase regulatory-like domain-containing protein [Bacteroidia bacterium]
MKNPFKIGLYLSVIILFSGAMLSGCKKDIDETQPIPTNTTSAIVSGRVLNEWNQPVAFAEVTCGNTTVITDANGLYSLNPVGLPGDRGVIRVSRSGYVTNYIGVSPSSVVQYLNIILPAVQFESFTNSTGGTITASVSGSKLVFPQDAVVNVDGTPYSGQVMVHINISDNSDSLYRMSFPGGDHQAVDLQNASLQFSTYSFAYIGLFSGTGAPLKMSPGKIASIQLPIPASQLGSAPTTTTLCSFNEETGLWEEEGIANKNGNYYEGTVSHFSFWGCGSLHAGAFLRGRVLDCNSNPIPYTIVYFDSENYAFTNNDGYFSRMVPANLSFPLYVPPVNALGVFSQTYNINALSPGQQFDMGDIVLQCPAYLTGNLVGCNSVPVPGWVEVNYGSQFGFTMYYTTNGNFSVPVKSNANVTMRYVTASKIVTGTATSPAQNNALNLGTIAMCYVPDTANTFTLNGAGFNNETLVLDVTASSAQFRQNGNTFLSLTGTTLQGHYVTIYANFTGNTIGTYNCDPAQINYIRVSVSDQVNNVFKSFSSETPASSCDLQVLSYGNEIGRLKTYFTGTLATSAASGSQSVTISGKMDLARVPDWRSSGQNVLTANGDGFSSQSILFDWCPSTSFYSGYVAGNYRSATNETVMKFVGCISSSNGGFNGSFRFKGNTVGVYTAPADFYTNGFSIRKNFNGSSNRIYDEIVSGSITINSYPPPGGFITGTFSGVFKRTDPVSGSAVLVNVTNASFSSWHYPDE